MPVPRIPSQNPPRPMTTAPIQRTHTLHLPFGLGVIRSTNPAASTQHSRRSTTRVERNPTTGRGQFVRIKRPAPINTASDLVQESKKSNTSPRTPLSSVLLGSPLSPSVLRWVNAHKDSDLISPAEFVRTFEHPFDVDMASIRAFEGIAKPKMAEIREDEHNKMIKMWRARFEKLKRQEIQGGDNTSRNKGGDDCELLALRDKFDRILAQDLTDIPCQQERTVKVKVEEEEGEERKSRLWKDRIGNAQQERFQQGRNPAKDIGAHSRSKRQDFHSQNNPPGPADRVRYTKSKIDTVEPMDHAVARDHTSFSKPSPPHELRPQYVASYNDVNDSEMWAYLLEQWNHVDAAEDVKASPQPEDILNGIPGHFPTSAGSSAITVGSATPKGNNTRDAGNQANDKALDMHGQTTCSNPRRSCHRHPSQAKVNHHMQPATSSTLSTTSTSTSTIEHFLRELYLSELSDTIALKSPLTRNPHEIPMPRTSLSDLHRSGPQGQNSHIPERKESSHEAFLREAHEKLVALESSRAEMERYARFKDWQRLQRMNN